MKNYLPLLEKQLQDYQAKCAGTDAIPVLEILWYCYFQENPIDDGLIRNAELELRPAFEALSFETSEALFSKLDDLIAHYQRSAFFDGLYTGAQLAKQLR